MKALKILVVLTTALTVVLIVLWSIKRESKPETKPTVNKTVTPTVATQPTKIILTVTQPQRLLTWTKVPCLACGGDGVYVYHICSVCGGRLGFWVICWECKGKGRVVAGAGAGVFASQFGDVGLFGAVVTDRCQSCKGSGKVFLYCSNCGGTGQIPERCASCEGRGWLMTLR